MKLAERTFKRKDYKITSKFGKREVIKTQKGTTSTFHNGCDYGTKGQKWPLYPLEAGYVYKCGTLADGCKYVGIRYQRLGIDLEYFHLSEYTVKKGQYVNENISFGKAGMTGKATGIHLHLQLSKIGSYTRTDPELYDYIPICKNKLKTNEEIAKEVIRGDWGNGAERKKRLQEAGYNYSEIQKLVNKLLKG